MAVTMSRATVGYNSNQVKKLLNNIKATCITDAASKMTKGLATLNTEVDAFWKGTSADMFKSNMAADVKKITAALNASYKALESEILAIENAMGQTDKKLIQKRS